MASFLRHLAQPIYRRIPLTWRRSIRARRLERLVRAGIFNSDEPEFQRLGEWLTQGDTALDIGANFGSYSLSMSALVGDTGRVFSFEPVPQTFNMLVRSLAARGCRNVTALNLACSNQSGLVPMCVPDDPLTGEDLYQASIRGGNSANVVVCRIRLDDLPLPTERLRLVKVDAEGHDAEVIEGMLQTLRSSMPVLITEHPTDVTTSRLKLLGYQMTTDPRSPNSVYLPIDK